MLYSAFLSRYRFLFRRPCGHRGFQWPAAVAALMIWAWTGCKREAPPPPIPSASVAGTATALPPDAPPAPRVPSSPPAFIVLSDTLLPQPTEKNLLVFRDFYDTLAFSLDTTEPKSENGNPVPEEPESLPGNILTSGTFHGNEVPEDVEQQEWLGAFIDSGICRIQPTRIHVRLVRDPAGEPEGDTTGKEVTTEVNGTPAFMSRNIAALEAGSCDVMDSTGLFFSPGRRLTFRYRDVEYVLAATSHRTLRFQYDPGQPLFIFRLILTRKSPDGDISEGVLRIFNGEGITLQRLGDFDHDGIPDLLLNNAGYNTEATTLYLSRPAAPGKLLKRVGSFVITGC